jgi:GTP-binding protein
VIRVPRGTLIKESKSGAIICDVSSDEPFVLAKGGRGGWGNQHFATPTRQAPRFAKSGLPGDELIVTLELKLLADVGLVGFPNVGKSTLLSVISSARPKIANYHFTTLSPNLGVVRVDEGSSFVVADIPGIIEGASSGAGLGHDFLRHIDRCRLLIHVLDASGIEGRDPVEDFDAINLELSQYSPELAGRPQVIAANKCDIVSDPSVFDRLKKRADESGCELYKISAATRAGVDELMRAVASRLHTLPPVAVYQPDYHPDLESEDEGTDISITHADDVWNVEGKWLARLVNNINFSDYESRSYFEKVLRRHGVYDRLEDAGINEGDTVSIYDIEFEYVP